MSGYVIAGYAVTLGTIGTYVLWTLRRRRHLRAAAGPDAGRDTGDERS